MNAKRLLTKDGWNSDCCIETDELGSITSIRKSEVESDQILLPGFRNAHSHAFQYAMAGLAENHLDPSDDFWSWREAMYSLALAVEPEDIEAIATMLYSELVKLGYSHVAEFHYLQHNRDGSRYDDIGEIGVRLFRAARTAGIKITLVPVYYRNGGFGKPGEDKQRRFLFKNTDEYFRLVERLRSASVDFENAGIGIGVHSLRAADAEEIIEIAEALEPGMPFHIHISEQKREVEECIEHLGARPVEWLVNNVELDQRFNLVHATHVNENELRSISEASANVVLCPTTEGNLGDGIFPLKRFMELGGQWSIGTDSHVSLDPFEELRLLDYGQRLTTFSRNTFGEEGMHLAVETAFDAGRDALGLRPSDFFEDGTSFDACVVSSSHPLITNSPDVSLLNTIIYAHPESDRSGIVNGEQRHAPLANITDAFSKTISRLRNA